MRSMPRPEALAWRGWLVRRESGASIYRQLTAGIRSGRSHPVWGRGLADGADWPVRRNPFPRGMRQRGGEIDDAGGLVDGRGLYIAISFWPKVFAHDVEPLDSGA